MEVTSEHAFKADWQKFCCIMFQSLFSWKLHQSLTNTIQNSQCFQAVSILVFMEVTSELGIIISLLKYSCICFNPCFHGSYIRAAQGAGAVSRGRSWFQSLFSWKLHQSPVDERDLSYKHREFQSLFSWKLHQSGSGKVMTISVSLSFNPCFHGSYIRAFYCKKCLVVAFPSFNPCFHGSYIRAMLTLLQVVCICIVSILVFMEVTSELKLTKSNSILHCGFNPCFHGSYIRAASFTISPGPSKMFQSLFSWKLHQSDAKNFHQLIVQLGFNPCFHGSYIRAIDRIQTADTIGMFQSLFSWKLHQSLESHVIGIPHNSFNPCFHGSYIRARPDYNSRYSINLVSILVFMEVTSERWLPSPGISRMFLFQSLFSWKLHQSIITKSQKTLSSTRVSILVFMEVTSELNCFNLVNCFFFNVSILVFMEVTSEH
ncbi:conserved hypothetical protein, membrane [Candidatus Magnetomorum sp. HK-1]|nr:conserved hypothetical protein, membrane [Candidatus Magnetomorum sp. HK-1]